MKRVIVLAGGRSQEREISLRSGQAILDALKATGYPCALWDPKTDSVETLLAFQPDVAFIALHGLYGEDGCIQGFLETLGIPYTGPGVAASAIGMNKQLTKKILAYEGLPTPAFLLTDDSEPYEETIARTAEKLGFPVILKAADQGSSIGVLLAESAEDMRTALAEVYRYDHKIVIEQFIKGLELTVAVMGPAHQPVTLPIIEIAHADKVWDFEAKYNASMFRHIIPARISPALEQKVKQFAAETYRRFNCQGFSRIDFMVDEAENPYILEINTVPGCTETSLFPDAAKSAGIAFTELVKQIVEGVALPAAE